MILGIDFGATTTDLVLVKKKKIIKFKSLPVIPLNEIKSYLVKYRFNSSKIREIHLTGGKTAGFKGNLLKPTIIVPELKAIALGALTLARKKKALIASLGTGTAIINAKSRKEFKHLGGTGVSGGTLLGLSKLILNTTNLKEIELLALKGSLKKVDLQIEDIIGKGIGILPGNATASNFAKLSKARFKNTRKEDLALGIINLIAETNSVAINFAARETKQKNIILTGKLITLKTVRKRIQGTAEYFGKKFIIPRNAGIATAFGAAISK